MWFLTPKLYDILWSLLITRLHSLLLKYCSDVYSIRSPKKVCCKLGTFSKIFNANAYDPMCIRCCLAGVVVIYFILLSICSTLQRLVPLLLGLHIQHIVGLLPSPSALHFIFHSLPNNNHLSHSSNHQPASQQMTPHYFFIIIIPLWLFIGTEGRTRLHQIQPLPPVGQSGKNTYFQRQQRQRQHKIIVYICVLCLLFFFLPKPEDKQK